LDRGEGKTSVSDPAVADAVRVMSTAITKMQEITSNASGHSKGVGDSWGIVVGLAGICLAGVTIFAVISHITLH
jgi:hypothetical protein